MTRTMGGTQTSMIPLCPPRCCSNSPLPGRLSLNCPDRPHRSLPPHWSYPTSLAFFNRNFYIPPYFSGPIRGAQSLLSLILLLDDVNPHRPGQVEREKFRIPFLLLHPAQFFASEAVRVSISLLPSFVRDLSRLKSPPPLSPPFWRNQELYPFTAPPFSIVPCFIDLMAVSLPSPPSILRSKCPKNPILRAFTSLFFSFPLSQREIESHSLFPHLSHLVSRRPKIIDNSSLVAPSFNERFLSPAPFVQTANSSTPIRY